MFFLFYFMHTYQKQSVSMLIFFLILLTVLLKKIFFFSKFNMNRLYLCMFMNMQNRVRRSICGFCTQ